MNDLERNKLEQAIEQAINDTNAAIVDLETNTQPVSPDSSIGRLSRMDNIVNQSVSEASLQSARLRLNDLIKARERLKEDPDFGHCEECGEPIPINRLLAIPSTVFCVHCAE